MSRRSMMMPMSSSSRLAAATPSSCMQSEPAEPHESTKPARCTARRTVSPRPVVLRAPCTVRHAQDAVWRRARGAEERREWPRRSPPEGRDWTPSGARASPASQLAATISARYDRLSGHRSSIQRVWTVASGEMRPLGLGPWRVAVDGDAASNAVLVRPQRVKPSRLARDTHIYTCHIYTSKYMFS